MVIKERLIKIPVPSFNLVTTSKIDGESFCLSYQYDIDKDGFGSYGFNTNKAERFLHLMFPDLYFFDGAERVFTKKSSINEYGLYFFDNYEGIKIETEKHKLLIKKNEMLSRKGIVADDIHLKPILWDLNEGDKIKNSVINKLNELGCGFFIVNNYTPEAGKSLIFTNEKYLNKIKEIADVLDIKFKSSNSIDELKPW